MLSMAAVPTSLHGLDGDAACAHLLATPASLPPGTYAGACQPWVQVNDDAFGLDDPSGQTPPYQAEDGFEVTVFKDQLYVGMEADNLYGARVWRTKAGVTLAHNQGDWEQVVDDAFGDVNNNDHIDSLEGFSGCFYASTAMRNENRDGTGVWRSSTGDAGSWSQVNTDGFGDANNGKVIVDAGTVYNGALYLATLNRVTGAEVWRTTDGITWTQVNADGFGDGDTFAAELIPFNGYLYAWATNYQTGQKVMRTKCPICQSETITGPGTYTFDGVGTEITFSQENLDSVEGDGSFSGGIRLTLLSPSVNE